LDKLLTMILPLVCAIIIILPFFIGLIAVVLFGRKQKRHGPIGLLFHAITDTPAPHCSYYAPDRFESVVCRLVGEGYSFVTVAQANAVKNDKSNTSSRSVVLTFDDGFDSFYTKALPILEHHGCQTTVFAVAGYIGKASSWDALPQQKHLNNEQLREISDLGHEIGSHTLSHANLILLDDKELQRELSESKIILEQCIGKPVTSISFPFGRFNKRVWAVAQRIGYTSATSYVSYNADMPEILPLWGAYSYDSVQDVFDRAVRQKFFSNALTRGYLMPHFAKGSPLWKFRDTYSIIR
jgi:peptidoglycan/xylan/chitin deacetylase (PgdA/CDA1 family)